VSSSRRGAVVTRDYKNSPDDCARALELLLKKPVSKAVEPAPEPDGRDGTKVQEDSANGILPD
jgi:hypothetical protein